jgi:hypothetical protein
MARNRTTPSPASRMAAVAAVAVLASALGAAGAVAAPGRPAQTPGASTTTWLCRPGLAHDPCTLDRATTIVRGNGGRTVPRSATRKPLPVDCFYVYPTVSRQPGDNADLTIDPEETAVAEVQASRFSSVCRVFAPMYPQLTVQAIRNGVLPAGARARAYLGVLSAWRDYLANDNHGRGVVLIGHSQGSAMLAALLRLEIEPQPDVRRRIVSAFLIGSNVTVAAGRDTGGTFQTIPACRSRSQTGCVVAYSSFDQPPPPDSRFGRVTAAPATTGSATTGPREVLCVNPAAPGGGRALLASYWRTMPFPGPVGLNARPPFQAATPWVETPHLYAAHCEQRDGASWLQIDDAGRPGDSRPRVHAVLGPTWGLHLYDVNLALGNLVDLARDEATAYTARHR